MTRPWQRSSCRTLSPGSNHGAFNGGMTGLTGGGDAATGFDASSATAPGVNGLATCASAEAIAGSGALISAAGLAGRAGGELLTLAPTSNDGITTDGEAGRESFALIAAMPFSSRPTRLSNSLSASAGMSLDCSTLK